MPNLCKFGTIQAKYIMYVYPVSLSHTVTFIRWKKQVLVQCYQE